MQVKYFVGHMAVLRHVLGGPFYTLATNCFDNSNVPTGIYSRNTVPTRSRVYIRGVR